MPQWELLYSPKIRAALMSNPYNNNPMWILTRKFIFHFTFGFVLKNLKRFFTYSFLSIQLAQSKPQTLLICFCAYLTHCWEMSLRNFILCHGNSFRALGISPLISHFFPKHNFSPWIFFMSQYDRGCFHAWRISLFLHMSLSNY